MSRYKLRLILTLTLSALILGYWGFHEPHRPAFGPAGRSLDNEVDGYLVGARMVQFDAEGQPLRTLVANRLDHYPQRDQTLVQDPDLTLTRPGRTPLHITANRGWVRGSDDQVRLEEEVVVADLARAGYRLETPSLTLDPDRNYGETADPVLIHHGSGETRAIGMRLFLDQDRVQLLERVRGTHAPN